MFTMVYLLLALPVVGGLFYLLGVARVWRSDRVVAVLMFFFWPVGLYALFKYWNGKDDNPRLPLLLALAAFAAWGGLVGWNVSHAPLPASADMDNLDVPTDAVESDAIADRVRRSLAIANLRRRTGNVDIPDAPVSIDVPAHFRFIDRAALLNAFHGSADEPTGVTVGWLVHERVDLGAANAWHVEVDYLGDGYVPSADFAAIDGAALLARSQASMRKLAQEDAEDAAEMVGFAEAPSFDAGAARLTWVEELAPRDRPGHLLDCYAIALGRKGALLFSISDAAPRQQELCLRSVRMLAAHAHFGPGQTYADHSRALDRDAPYTLTDLVTGTYLADAH